MEPQTLSTATRSVRMPLLMILAFLFIGMIVGTLLASLVNLLISEIWGIPISSMVNINADTPFGERQFFRTLNLVSHVLTFTLPGLATAYLFYKRKWWEKLALNIQPQGFFIVAGIVWLMVSFPFAQWSYWFNQQLPLPSWATSLEGQAEAMIAGLLNMESIGELIFSLLVMAVAPAVGEEIIFRGILQKEFEGRMRNPHVAIWAAAVIFSGFHMQFEGFLPRLILGALLGYLFYWSRNLWIPIIVHLFYNGIQIIAYYSYGAALDEMAAESEMPNLFLSLGSLVLFIIGGWYLAKHSKTLEEKIV
ncbi:MAG: CPBP family intramembrane metalloprotease [Saprospiraceae bacterium]|nr:CPBP family intramembrane metalloprotease [Saprospiraceae bacterium]